MKSWAIIILLIVAFAAGENVITTLGYPHSVFTTTAFFRLHPLTYVAAFLLAYYLFMGRITADSLVTNMRSELWFLLINVLLICFLKITGNLNAISFLFDTIILPVVLSILLKSTDKGLLFRFKNWIYFFFFLNAALSVIEKVSHTQLVTKTVFVDSEYFRSTALYGHPLNNGLIMSVLTVTLFLGTEKNRLKILVLFAGILSIFCFGARGALIGVLIGVTLNQLIYAVKASKLKYTHKKRKLPPFAFLATLAIIVGFIIQFTPLGDRISALAHVDDSAEVRVASYDVLHGLEVKDVLWGLGTDKIDYLQYTAGVEIIENFYIVWLLKFGLLMAALLLVGLINFLYKLMRNAPAEVKYPVLASFFFVASTNNSLSTSTLVISMFVLTYYIFFESREVKNAWI